MNMVQVTGLSRKQDNRWLVNDVSFQQQVHQKIAIAGSTGSGKTTLLKMIAGLVQPSEGRILFDGVSVKGPEEKLIPGHPPIAYLSQHFELRNHYRVEEIMDMANQLTKKEAHLIYEICRITNFLKRWTHQLSGGERQRVALARLLVARPKLLLLDEPFSNVDLIHKNILKRVITDVGDSLGITCMLVSHDPLDTLSWADEILVLKEGLLVQQGRPELIYKQPNTEYVAALFGAYTSIDTSLAKVFSLYTNIEMKIMTGYIRPEVFTVVNKGQGVEARVTASRFMGSYHEVVVTIDGNKIILHAYDHVPQIGDLVYVSMSS